MAFPQPQPGLVVRYDYVWTREAAAGLEQGKDRPSCLVAAMDDGRFVVLLPITHTPPVGETVGIEIPAKVRQSIGLDDEPCWVIVSESNVDTWPNGGITPVPGKSGQFNYGFIPPNLFEIIKRAFLECAEATPKAVVNRTL